MLSCVCSHQGQNTASTDHELGEVGAVSDTARQEQSLSVDQNTLLIPTQLKSNKGTATKIGESATTKLEVGRRGDPSTLSWADIFQINFSGPTAGGGALMTSGSFTMMSNNRAGNSGPFLLFFLLDFRINPFVDTFATFVTSVYEHEYDHEYQSLCASPCLSLLHKYEYSKSANASTSTNVITRARVLVRVHEG